MAKEKRFEKVFSEGMGTASIYVDRETGVQYLCISSGYGNGVTVLVDREGKPLLAHTEPKAPEF
ncbi:MAG: xylan 1,4-beta-xylosidase [Ruminococcaceae bacterium]|nr:xylan 1,4-beta-xylosidase [Oscillospiraceae bacterium]